MHKLKIIRPGKHRVDTTKIKRLWIDGVEIDLLNNHTICLEAGEHEIKTEPPIILDTKPWTDDTVKKFLKKFLGEEQ